MGVITANRGASRGDISYNIMESMGSTFIVNNNTDSIYKNIVKDTIGISSNNIGYSIEKNRASRISLNTARGISNNIGDCRIGGNTIDGVIYANVILTNTGIQNNNILGNISGNVAYSIYGNGVLVSVIGGNFIKGTIDNNNSQGEITSNYSGSISNNI